MAKDNLVDIEFSSEEMKAINDSIAKINEVLSTKVVSITTEERTKYGRIADKNKVLVDKVKVYMEQASDTIPPMVNKDNFDKDYAARNTIELILKQLTRIIDNLKDTKTLLDYDNYNATTTYYRYVKFLAENSNTGAKSIYQDLKKHYAITTKKANDTDASSSASEEIK